MAPCSPSSFGVQGPVAGKAERRSFFALGPLQMVF